MTTPKTTVRERAANFVERLRRVRQDRGKMAALRRALSPATAMDAWPVVAGLGGQIGKPGESVFVEIAALFASHPEESKARNFGETCRLLAGGGDEESLRRFDPRFRRLLACADVADLCGQLRSLIRMASSKGVGVNYESLFADMWNWKFYADDIRVSWAKAFWQAEDSIPAPASTNTEIV